MFRLVHYIVFFYVVLSMGNLVAQELHTDRSNSVSDCSGAVLQPDSSYAFIEMPKKYGIIRDLALIENQKMIYENNSIWLRLETQQEGWLTFTIYPENQNEDFQFYLFKGGMRFCDEILSKEVKPLISKKGIAPGNCGIKKMEVDENAPVNLDEQSFFPAVYTDAYQIFYLLIDHETGKEKFKFSWNVIEKEKTQTAIPEHTIQNFSSDRGNHFILKIQDKESKYPVSSTVRIEGNKLDNGIFIGNAFKFDIEKSGPVIVDVSAEGYFFEETEFKLAQDHKPQNQELIIYLEKLKVGGQLSLPDIKFFAGSDEFLPSAYSTLKRLLDFMVTNNNISIEIQGHVNEPEQDNNRELQRLSEKRAMAVLNFLKNNGVDKDRMVSIGFGNTQMKYEDPKDESEASMNRRVEIKIIDLK